MNKALSKNSLYVTLAVVVISIVIVLMSLQTAYTYFTTKDRIIQNMEKSSHQTIQSLQKNITSLIETYSVNGYVQLIHNELHKNGIFAIVVEDFKMGKILGSKVYISGQIKENDTVIREYDSKNKEQNEQLAKCFYSDKYSIKNKENQIIGKVTIYISDSYMKNELNNIILSLAINLSIISLSLIFSLILAIKFIIIEPISNIITIIEEYDEDGLPINLIPQKGPSEIVALTNTMNNMIMSIKKSIEKERHFQSEILKERNLISEQSVLLKQQKEEFETIFKHAKDGIAILDLESNFLDFNDAYLKMTGFTREELLTKSCMELTIDEDKKKNEKVLEATLKNGYVENFEKSCVTKDNRIITVNMSIALMPDNQRLLISTKNITQNKLLESQAKLASMGEMIGNIAHQWRQPLSVINLLASTIAFKQENQTLKENDIIPNMDKIITQSSYLSKTIDDFRNFIKSSDEKSTINLSSVLEKTFSIVNPTLSNNYIKTILDIDKTLEIEGFENGLMQVFINIINNSKDALNENLSQTSKKYIFISIHKRDDKIEVIFKDNAGGIKEDILNRIFEPYFTTKHQSQGTGLGLSMAYTIINERHNGIIEAKNETFQYEENTYTGACVTISFVA